MLETLKMINKEEKEKAKQKEKLKKENGIQPASDEDLFITAGSNMGFVNAILAITDPGDEVILPAPFYFNHEMAIQLASCVPVIVSTTGALGGATLQSTPVHPWSHVQLPDGH